MTGAPVIVTDENFGDLLIQSAEEALAYVRGEGSARVHLRVRHRATPAPAPAAPPPAYDAARIRELRVRLGFNQHGFAQALNVSGQTVKAWEQGVNTPSGAARRLLEVAERHPEVLRGAAAE